MSFFCKQCKKDDTEKVFYSYMKACCIDCHKIRNKKYQEKKNNKKEEKIIFPLPCSQCKVEKEYPTDFYESSTSKACRDCHKKQIIERTKKVRLDNKLKDKTIQEFEQRRIKDLEEQVRLLNLLVNKK